MLKTFTDSFHIYAYQTDLNGRLRPGALMEIMQEMAGAHAEALGIGRNALLQSNLVWVLTRLEVQMERYPAYGEKITVETFPLPNRRWFFPRCFVFRDEEDRQIGCASTLWVLLDIQERRMSRPDPIVPMLPDNSDLIPPMAMPGTVGDVEAEPVAASLMPLYTDIDLNGHVNNTRYVDWCCNALGVETMRQYELARFTVNFNQEIRPGQEVLVQLRHSGERFSFSGFAGDTRHFDVGGDLRSL